MELLLEFVFLFSIIVCLPNQKNNLFGANFQCAIESFSLNFREKGLDFKHNVRHF